ncbi:alpha/beta fold hydrolase [Caldimonas sp. KR1-144]|uniref:alpha/beta fold hydrolase n=1 Tax=Caldimonas sp. KR1-144 TaxID=3400911 RepID=UPI003C11086A
MRMIQGLVRTTLVVAVRVVLLAALLIALWLGVTSAMRMLREQASPATLAPTGGRWIDAGDARIYTQAWGPTDGPLVVLVHGTGAWSGTWFELPQALASAGWRVVALDLPPFGMSERVAPALGFDYSRAAQARRVLSVIDALETGPVVLVGHSFGAGPALEAAVQSPSRLRKLVLVDPALGLGAAGEAPACTPPGPGLAWLLEPAIAPRLLRASAVSATATLPPLTGHWLGGFVHRREAVTPQRVAAYQHPFARSDFSAVLGDWAAGFAQGGCETAASLQPERLTAWARAQALPVELLWGEADTVTPIAQAKALQAWMPGARLHVLPGLGHIPHIEDPGAFSAVLREVIGAR